MEDLLLLSIQKRRITQYPTLQYAWLDTSSSMNCVLRTIQQFIEDEISNHTLAATSMKYQIYVDDVLWEQIL